MQRHNDQPANLGLVLIGTSILSLGWYGFNAGSALAIDNVAVRAMLTTTVATAAAMSSLATTGSQLYREGFPSRYLHRRAGWWRSHRRPADSPSAGR
ncbi:hypothetical protein [Limosilactobacillus fermentum]